jgi:hypothetical protein
LRDDADVFRFVMVRLNRRSCRVRREEDIAIVRSQFECVEWTGEPWKAANKGREMAHASLHAA